MATHNENPSLSTRISSGISPMNTITSILLFGGPTLLLFASFHWFRAGLENMGMGPFDALIVSMIGPLAILTVLPLAGYYLENPDKEFNVERFLKRFRFDQFRWKYMMHALVGYIILNLIYGAVMQINIILIGSGVISVPDNVTPLFEPQTVFDMGAFEQFIGQPLSGNYRVLFLYTLLLAFNIIGEELWWRGYILPRQEAHYGRYTWIVHGLLWNIFHAFKWWDLIPLLPVTLIIAYIAQRQRNNWTVFFMHLFFNGMFGVVLLIQVI